MELNSLVVKFYDKVDDKLIKFAVIISRHKNKWVFCKHKDRETYECPGGHREFGEDIYTTANRELFEETGAIDYNMYPICVYSVCDHNGEEKNDVETYGMLFYADVKSFQELPDYEIEKIELFEELPSNWTYPLIQPLLIEKFNVIIRSMGEE